MTQKEMRDDLEAKNDVAQQATSDLFRTPTTPKSYITVINFIAFLMVSLSLLLIIYVVWPFHPLTVKSTSIVTPNVKAGSSLVYKVDSCKNTPDTPTVYKKIVSAGYSESLPSSPGVIDEGCSDTKVVLPIPNGTPPGKYILYTEIDYSVNAIRTIRVFWQAGPFSVVQ
jgi:hypothetical protein